MGAIQVKNVPAELHEAIRRRAASEGVDLQDYVLQALRRDLGLPSQREWLDELHRQPDVIGVPPATEVLDDERWRRHGADRH